MKNLILCLTVFAVCNFLTAQNFDFGKVSKAELLETVHPLDSSANAAYLNIERNTILVMLKSKLGMDRIIVGEKFVRTQVVERIKFYNQEALNYATKNIFLYKKGLQKEHILKLEGYTYNLKEGVIERESLNVENNFTTERSENIDEVVFTMPNVKVGSIIEIRYTVESPFFTNVDEFVFQHSIPVKRLKSRFLHPENLNFRPAVKGIIPLTYKSEKQSGYLKFKEENLSGVNTATLDFEEVDDNVITYQLFNVPALKNEAYVNNIRNYRASTKFELISYKLPKDGTIKHFATNWNDVVNSIYKDPRFGQELDKSFYFRKDLKPLIASVKDPKRKLEVIFNYVKSRMVWNGKYSKFTRYSLENVYKERVGNSAEINLMLTAMLRYAKLYANPVLVSTRSNGIPLYPTVEGYNYVITRVNLPEGKVLLDATNPNCDINVLPLRVLNWQGKVIREGGYAQSVNLYPKQHSRDNVSIVFQLKGDGSIEGSCRKLKTNNSAFNFRESYTKSDKSDQIKDLESKYGDIEISEYAVKSFHEVSKPIMESFDFYAENRADIIGDKLYFSPLFFLQTRENPFKLEERHFPVDFAYPVSVKYHLNISIPKEYQVESLPESYTDKLPNGMGAYKYVISKTDSQIQLVIDFLINQSVIMPEDYKSLKTFFGNMINKESEQIILVKKTNQDS